MTGDAVAQAGAGPGSGVTVGAVLEDCALDRALHGVPSFGSR